MNRRPRQGFGLLEVIAAMTIFTVAVVTILIGITEAMGALNTVRKAEAETMAAARFFDAVALWSREDLDRHLGERVQGQWIMFTERSAPALYDVVLRDTVTGVTVLATQLYRPVRRGQNR